MLVSPNHALSNTGLRIYPIMQMPTQKQRKTLTMVVIEPTGLALDCCCSTNCTARLDMSMLWLIRIWQMIINHEKFLQLPST